MLDFQVWTENQLAGEKVAASGISYQHSFSRLCAERKAEAHRSVLVKVNSRADSNHVYQQCQQFGKVANAMHFKNNKDYILVEFENKTCIPGFLSTVNHFQNDQKVPAETRLLYLTSSANKRHSQAEPDLVPSFETPPLLLSDFTAIDSLSDQMEMLYQNLRLTDLGQRLRFFICSTLEDMLKGLFPHCHVYPFGSSVNGFGRNDCDLDMILKLCPAEHQNSKKSDLKFLTKWRQDEDERRFSCHNLQVFAEMIQNFIPSCIRVNPILKARVPIIKFYHEACGIECDLSLQNTSGVTMSNLMYMLGERDHRVRLLIFTVRHWAKVNGVTHQSPGPWLSNFMLSILVICFLQLRSKPVLPPLLTLLNATDDTQLPPQLDEETHLDELLPEFLHFYSKFDFKTIALSPLQGKCFLKPDYAPLYIENPVDINLNIAKNVSNRELTKLIETMKVAIWQLTNNGQSLVNVFHSEDSKRVLKKRLNVQDLFKETTFSQLERENNL